MKKREESIYFKTKLRIGGGGGGRREGEKKILFISVEGRRDYIKIRGRGGRGEEK